MSGGGAGAAPEGRSLHPADARIRRSALETTHPLV